MNDFKIEFVCPNCKKKLFIEFKSLPIAESFVKLTENTKRKLGIKTEKVRGIKQ